jgi:hypothetical protein
MIFKRCPVGEVSSQSLDRHSYVKEEWIELSISDRIADLNDLT